MVCQVNEHNVINGFMTTNTLILSIVRTTKKSCIMLIVIIALLRSFIAAVLNLGYVMAR